MRDNVWSRLLGVGLTAVIAALTLALASTDRLGLYINPESSWFAVSMAVVALVGTVLSFTLRLGDAADHGHDHGAEHASQIRTSRAESDHSAGTGPHSRHPSESMGTRMPRRDLMGTRMPRRDPMGTRMPRRDLAGASATVGGGVLALGVAGAMLVVPPATLSAELAMSRDTGSPPLFQGADTVALAVMGDTASFGVGDWASVFATATDPQTFDGTEISLTGFVTPGDAGFDLARLVITHCVIDAQPASVPVVAGDVPARGDWVTVTGTIREMGGQLRVEASAVEVIDEPEDPYEF